jgi:hypothetical protein
MDFVNSTFTVARIKHGDPRYVLSYVPNFIPKAQILTSEPCFRAIVIYYVQVKKDASQPYKCNWQND